MVPKQGPINGSQYLTMTKWVFEFFIFVPILIQLKGLIEFIKIWIDKSIGAGSLENWVVPGNKNCGYCREKV